MTKNKRAQRARQRERRQHEGIEEVSPTILLVDNEPGSPANVVLLNRNGGIIRCNCVLSMDGGSCGHVVKVAAFLAANG